MKSGTVLLAEDDEQINDMLSDFLTSEGYRVVRVFDGREAIRALGETAFDCAVLDLMMPGADGRQVLDAMEQLCPELVAHTIMMSAYPIGVPQTRRAQVAAVLQKPFEIDTLSEHIDRCMAASAAARRDRAM